jgi:diguanylate cyclase (GGDEF)-like protein
VGIPITTNRRLATGSASIGNLLLGVFVAGLLISALAVYSTFNAYRASTVHGMARADAKRISQMVFEHLYSVMRKGWTRTEIDDVIHHIQVQLPGYEIVVIRGEPVVRQFGDRPGHAELRESDEAARAVLSGGGEQVRVEEGKLRYLLPVTMSAECSTCHTSAHVGEVNGVIAVNVPTAVLYQPIENLVFPIMKLALVLVAGLLLLTFLFLRLRVSNPITELTAHVSTLSEQADYSRDLALDEHWPKEVRSLAENFNGLMARVRDSHDQLRDLSIHDPLTSLFNRRHFDTVLEQATFDASQGSVPFSVLLIDLDRFKPINDLFGHAAGDAVLMVVGKAIQNALRDTDMAARIGGDEFAILALATNPASAHELAARLRQAIAKPELRFGQEIVHPACSIGVASYPEDARLAADLMRIADNAMYDDKNRQGSSR